VTLGHWGALERDGPIEGEPDVVANEQLAPLNAPLVLVNVTVPVGVTGVPAPVEYQIAFTLPSSYQRVLGIALSRAKRDFTATERDLLNLTRPYLIQVYRNALAHTELARGAGRQIVIADLRALGLTQRQAEVLRLVAMGSSDQAAATVLGIGMRTAQKHLERCYRTLAVSDRSQAAQLAWAAARNG
jgi:DNA-binding CsgD family transcriptional regulator